MSSFLILYKFANQHNTYRCIWFLCNQRYLTFLCHRRFLITQNTCSILLLTCEYTLFIAFWYSVNVLFLLHFVHTLNSTHLFKWFRNCFSLWYALSQYNSFSSQCSSVSNIWLSCTFAAVNSTLCTHQLSLSAPICALPQKYHWFHFLVLCISGSRLPFLFFVLDGAWIIVASTVVHSFKSNHFFSKISFILLKIFSCTWCFSIKCLKFKIVVSSGTDCDNKSKSRNFKNDALSYIASSTPGSERLYRCCKKYILSNNFVSYLGLHTLYLFILYSINVVRSFRGITFSISSRNFIPLVCMFCNLAPKKLVSYHMKKKTW